MKDKVLRAELSEAGLIDSFSHPMFGDVLLAKVKRTDIERIENKLDALFDYFGLEAVPNTDKYDVCDKQEGDDTDE